MDDDMEPLFGIDDLERWKRGALPPDWLKRQAAILKRRAERFRDELEEQAQEGPDRRPPGSIDRISGRNPKGGRAS